MLDEKFVVSLLMRHTKLKKEHLEKVKSWDGDGLKQLILYLVEASPGLALPHDMLNKQVANKSLDKRIAAVGNRLRPLALNNGIQSDGTICWSSIAPTGWRRPMASSPRSTTAPPTPRLPRRTM